MFGWLNKKKNKMTEEQLIPYWEELSAVPKFQWVKTDKAGQVCEFKGVSHQNGMILVEFTDGTRVNYDLLGDAVMKILDDSMLLEINGSPVQQAPVPAKAAPIGNVSIGKTQEENPIHALLKKQKDNPVPIEITVHMNLPPVALYGVLSSSFDNADEEIVDYVVSGIDVTKIKEAVKEAIINFYKDNNG